jgi:hypothetical protein
MSGAGTVAMLRTVLPLDLIPKSAVACAYSLRLLRRDYTGPAIKVFRVSDSVQADVSFDSTGRVSGNSPVSTGGNLTSFVGSGNVLVTVWYDQSTNSNNANQASSSLMPKLATSGAFYTQNNRLGVYYANGSMTVADSPSIELNTTMTALFVFNVTTFAGINALLDKRLNMTPAVGYHVYIAPNTLGMQWNATGGETSVASSPTLTNNTLYSFSFTAIRNSTVKFYKKLVNYNTQTLSTATGTSVSAANLFLGAHSNQPSLNFNGVFFECILLNQIYTPEQQFAGMINNQSTYFSIP